MNGAVARLLAPTHTLKHFKSALQLYFAYMVRQIGLEMNVRVALMVCCNCFPVTRLGTKMKAQKHIQPLCELYDDWPQDHLAYIKFTAR